MPVLRVLAKNTGFTVFAVGTLAIGIGASTAVSSIVSSVFLHATPYPDAGRLVILRETWRGLPNAISYPNFRDWQKQAQSFVQLHGFLNTAGILYGVEQPALLSGRLISAGFLETLGAKPMLGRTFTKDEDLPGKAPYPIMLSHEIWRTYFGADPAVIGKAIRLDAESHTVVGILPPDFYFWPVGADYFLPLRVADSSSGHMDRANHTSLTSLARMRAGVAPAQAAEEIRMIAARLEKEYPNVNRGVGAVLVPVQQWQIGKLRPTLLAFTGAVCLVLLIACVNVANLLLVRGSVRRREVAVRSALGASRWDVMRHLLSEVLVIVALGAGAGLLCAAWGIDFFKHWLPQGYSRIRVTQIDPWAVAGVLVLSTLTAVFFGALPAWRSSRVELGEALKASGRFASEGHRQQRLRLGLLAAEIALATIACTGASLLGKSLWNVLRVDPGFRSANLLAGRITPLPRRYAAREAIIALYSRLLDRARALPGVTGATMVGCLPIRGSCWGAVVSVAGRPIADLAQVPNSVFNTVGTDYFRVMGVRLVAGRWFDETDSASRRPVAVVSEAFASTIFPGESAIGKRIQPGFPPVESRWREIVGVVADVREDGLERESRPEVYLDHSSEIWDGMYVVVRTAGSVKSLAPVFERAVHEVDPTIAIRDLESMEELLAESTAPRRFALWLIGLFAGIALFLAMVGVFAVVAYSVSRRTREIGIRIALGAQQKSIGRMVIQEGTVIALVGLVAGLGVSAVLMRLLRTLLYGVSPFDGLAFLMVAIVLLATALLASCIPAYRAARVDPVTILREE